MTSDLSSEIIYFVGCVEPGATLSQDSSNVFSDAVGMGSEMTDDDQFEVSEDAVGMLVKGKALDGMSAGGPSHLGRVSRLEADRLDQVESIVLVAEGDIDGMLIRTSPSLSPGCVLPVAWAVDGDKSGHRPSPWARACF
jgi:hypothetical protein